MKKILSSFIILALALTVLSNTVIAVVIPRVGVLGPSSGTVEVGGTIRYPVSIKNNATSVNLKPSDVQLNGCTANISIEGNGNTDRTVVLSNIRGSVGATCWIKILGGVASNSAGVSLETGASTAFTIVATVNNNPTPSTPNNNNNNNSNPNNNNTLPPNVNNNGGNNNNNNSNPQPQEPEEETDKTNPTMQIGGFSKDSINLGDEIYFEVSYSDDKEMGDITLNENDITLYGFKADIKISGEGNTRRVTLSNVQGHLGGLKYVKIAGNTAKDKAGNSVKDGGKTGMFKVISKDTKNKPDDWVENPNTGR